MEALINPKIYFYRFRYHLIYKKKVLSDNFEKVNGNGRGSNDEGPKTKNLLFFPYKMYLMPIKLVWNDL